MAAKRLQAPKGTRDLLPPETALWAAVEATARRVFGLYGYGEIRTPIFEDTELFARGVGATSDIVGKEMYSFQDKSGRSLTLRPEGTAAVCRAYVEHGMQQWPQPVRLFYIGPQFRYERPQKGRHRQFHQIGAELLGAGRGPAADVEILVMLVHFLRELGFQDLQVLLNTVGDRESRDAFRERLRKYLLPLRERLSEDSRRRLETNPLRILDTKSGEEQELLAGAPRLEESLTPASAAHFERVLSAMDALALSFSVEPRLVRGLDYYTNTVFEVVSAGLGAQNAICGGGAYEGLVEELGGPPTYGVGFAIGEDRLLEVLPQDSRARQAARKPVVLLRLAGRTAAEPPVGSGVAERLRAAGIPVVDVGEESRSRAYAMASHLGATHVVVHGEDEAAAGLLTVRDTAARTERQLPWAEAVNLLRRRIEEEA